MIIVWIVRAMWDRRKYEADGLQPKGEEMIKKNNKLTVGDVLGWMKETMQEIVDHPESISEEDLDGTQKDTKGMLEKINALGVILQEHLDEEYMGDNEQINKGLSPLVFAISCMLILKSKVKRQKKQKERKETK